MPKSKPFSRKILTRKSENYFQCILCDKIYNHELGLKLHDNICPYSQQLCRKFPSEATFECISCGLSFNNKIQSKEHIIKIHGGDYKISARRC